MISEIRGKISQTGINLSDRLEDKLTGDFFGTLRYLPFEDGIKVVLSQAHFADIEEREQWNDLLSIEKGYTANYNFWPHHSKGEIDLLIELKNTLIGIEVKYLSGISSEDDPTKDINNYSESAHQLSRYSDMLEQLKGHRKAFLIFLSPYTIQRKLQQDLYKAYDISPNVSLGFVNWEDIHSAMINFRNSINSEIQQLIFEDIEQLLRVKQLIRFRGFTNKLFFENIGMDSYKYQKEKKLNMKNWSWPVLYLEEEQPYVYNS